MATLHCFHSHSTGNSHDLCHRASLPLLHCPMEHFWDAGKKANKQQEKRLQVLYHRLFIEGAQSTLTTAIVWHTILKSGSQALIRQGWKAFQGELCP